MPRWPPGKTKMAPRDADYLFRRRERDSVQSSRRNWCTYASDSVPSTKVQEKARLGWSPILVGPEKSFYSICLEANGCLHFSLYLFGNDLSCVQFRKTLFSFANLILIFNVYIFRSNCGGILDVPCLGTLVLLRVRRGCVFRINDEHGSNMSIEVNNNLSRPDHLSSVSRRTAWSSNNPEFVRIFPRSCKRAVNCMNYFHSRSSSESFSDY